MYANSALYLTALFGTFLACQSLRTNDSAVLYVAHNIREKIAMWDRIEYVGTYYAAARKWN